MLSSGVTSVIDIGLANELSVIHRDAVTTRKIIASRWLRLSQHVSGRERPGFERTGFETPLTFGLFPRSAQEAVEMVRARLDAGADMNIFQDGALPPEYYKPLSRKSIRRGSRHFIGPLGRLPGSKMGF